MWWCEGLCDYFRVVLKRFWDVFGWCRDNPGIQNHTSRTPWVPPTPLPPRDCEQVLNRLINNRFQATTCGQNQKVVSHQCVACDNGKTSTAGADASGADTTCQATTCGQTIQFVISPGSIKSRKLRTRRCWDRFCSNWSMQGSSSNDNENKSRKRGPRRFTYVQ